eukprot:snap_masked-scaffold_8-processed-gene-5.17-mRNA-1 protein AED:1.00 eAED:1.00 QI:0/-1/0/0/-1/1/1/0/104
MKRSVLDALIRYKDFGRWNQIVATGVLPGKTKSQIIVETESLIRSQKLAYFTGLRISYLRIRAFNDLQPGHRRKGMLVETGSKKPRDEFSRRREEVYAQLEGLQ